jgi:glycosyltransferase involved in cell wall biosynthesis
MLAHHILMLEKVWQHRNEFDLIHFHIDYLHFPLSRQAEWAQITTLHGRLDLPDLIPIYREFNEMPVVSISLRQRDFLPHANWVGNVYHGLPEKSLRFKESPGKYLAFIGRISPEKRPDRAIEIAVGAGIPLKIAAKVDAEDREYFNSVVQPLLDQPGIEFIGEIGDEEKSDFLGNAIASLAPIDWPEPFGLNMIEAMACGTPTVAFANGSVPEILDDGISGIIVETVEEAIRAVRRAAAMSRRACRRAFERRFTVGRMADEYLAIYKQLVGTGPCANRMLGLRQEESSGILKEDTA